MAQHNNMSSNYAQIMMTRKFISSLAQVKGREMSADDPEVMNIARYVISLDESGLSSEFIGPIRAVRLIDEQQTNIMFMTRQRRIGSNNERLCIPRYALLLAVAGDQKPPRSEPWKKQIGKIQ